MRHRLIALTVFTTFAFAGLATSASAGVYTVRACWDGEGANHSWRQVASNASVTALTQCPAGPTHGASNAGITARNSIGSGVAAGLSNAQSYFDAPPGTRIIRVWGDVNATGTQGWQAGIYDVSANAWKLCGPGCLSTLTWQPFDLSFSSYRVSAMAICGLGQGCPRSQLNGFVSLRNVHVVLQEDGAPTVSFGGGSLESPGWRRGVQSVSVNAWDPIGIRAVDLRVDGVTTRRHAVPCDFTFAIPCSPLQTVMQLDTAALADGRHTLAVMATDAAGNPGQTTRAIYVDNHAPTRPVDLRSESGSGWRSQNRFALRWQNPRQAAAPINSATVEFCRLRDLSGCMTVVSTRSGITSIGAQAPGPGEWRTRVWLADAAGNRDSQSYAETVIRLDSEPPTLALQASSSDRPSLVRVKATDRSGLATREILIRRRDAATWTNLAAKTERDGFSAMVDDEALPNGVYDVRARAVDLAGNERSTDRRADNKPMVLVLPLRIRTRLMVGKPKRVRARGAHGRHRYRIKLVRSPRAAFGRTIRLRGRLTSPGGNPLGGRDVRVFERTQLPTAPWRAIATLRTSAKGRFAFRALRGPSRTLRFRYDGSDTIRGRTVEVRLGVRAATSMRASRRRVVNGEGVTFRGRLQGGPRPTPGKLVEIQARARGGWRTFATTRAIPRSGRWSYQYRFSATRGNVRYRFRARVPRESGYPYESGVSRPVLVRVRGL